MDYRYDQQPIDISAIEPPSPYTGSAEIMSCYTTLIKNNNNIMTYA